MTLMRFANHLGHSRVEFVLVIKKVVMYKINREPHVVVKVNKVSYSLCDQINGLR
jgi:hypothetical protein